MTQLSAGSVAVEFGGTPLFADITFTVARGDRWGIVGRNGSGKSTIFRLLTGELEPTRGVVTRTPGLRVALLDQHRTFAGATSVWEAAAGPFAELFALEAALNELGVKIGELGGDVPPAMLDRYARDLERFQHEGGYEAEARVDAVLHGLGFDPAAARATPVTALSGGERGRLGLVRQLVTPADVLLLDEPTNHLDLETTTWLADYLAGVSETVVLISHDRDFLTRVVDHVLHLEGGTGYAYTGSYAAFVHQRTERRLAQQRAFDKQRAAIAAEEDYIRRNIAGGNSRQAKGRRRRLERVERLSAPSGEGDAMALRLESAARSGDQVLALSKVSIRIDDRVLVEPFSTTVTRGEVVGLVGANGSGKSTLLAALAGERPLAGGEVRIPESVRLAHHRQDLAQVPIDRTIYDAIADLRPSWPRGAVQGHLGRFGFTGDEVFRRASTLSGGERARLGLAILMLAGANLVFLDEPTNHLDIESIEALEDALEAYDGTVILVSHDRALLRSLTTRVWVFEGTRIVDFPGGFDEWEATLAARAAAVSSAVKSERRDKDRDNRQAKRAHEERRSAGSARRSAERAAAHAEEEVGRAEMRVRELERALEAPDLYGSPDGAQRATALAAELQAAKRTLDGAYERWSVAVEAVRQEGRQATVRGT